MRGDERTETSRTRHHLQGGVSAVSCGQPHSSRPARKPRRDEATAELENRTATGVSSGADRVDSSWRGENGARPRHPQDPLPHPATPPRCQTLKTPRRPKKPHTSSNSACGAGGVTPGPASAMTTLISLRIP